MTNHFKNIFKQWPGHRVPSYHWANNHNHCNLFVCWCCIMPPSTRQDAFQWSCPGGEYIKKRTFKIAIHQPSTFWVIIQFHLGALLSFGDNPEEAGNNTPSSLRPTLIIEVNGKTVNILLLGSAACPKPKVPVLVPCLQAQTLSSFYSLSWFLCSCVCSANYSEGSIASECVWLQLKWINWI